MEFSLKHALHSARLLLLPLLLVTAAATAAEPPRQEVEISAAQVQHYLAGVFPREYKALGGLFTLTARNPELSIPRDGDRLLMAFDASAGSAGGADTPLGRIRMSSGLRFDAQAVALYLEQPRLDDVQAASAGTGVDEQTRTLLNLWLADYARKQPLYRLDPTMAASLGDLRVESTAIENGSIKLRFNQPVSLPAVGASGD